MTEFTTVAISLAIILILFPLVYAFVRPVFTGAPFAPTSTDAVRTMIDMLTVLPLDTPRRAVDLGSGDGRILIALARCGFGAHGFELNPLLVWYSRVRIRKAGLEGRAFVHRQNYWNADLSGFDVVTLFGISYIMDALKKKLQKELKPGAYVISNYFSFPYWKPARTHGSVHLYVKNATGQDGS